MVRISPCSHQTKHGRFFWWVEMGESGWTGSQTKNNKKLIN